MMTVEVLQKYRDRQVVLNFYEDEALAEREGFLVDHIEITDTNIRFMQANQCRYTVDLELFPFFQVLPDFKNFFAVYNDQSRIEMYFPE